MVGRREAKTEAKLGEAAAAGVGTSIDPDSQLFEDVGRTGATGDGAVAVLGYGLPRGGDHNARRRRDVERSRAIAAGAAGVGDGGRGRQAVPRHGHHALPQGRGHAGDFRRGFAEVGERQEPGTEWCGLDLTRQHGPDQPADILLRGMVARAEHRSRSGEVADSPPGVSVGIASHENAASAPWWATPADHFPIRFGIMSDGQPGPGTLTAYLTPAQKSVSQCPPRPAR